MATSGATSSAQDQGSFNVNVGNGGLSAQVQAGAVDSSSASAIVDLNGNSNALIQSTSDLMTYDALVISNRPAVRSINVHDDGSVVVGYSQPAKFLGIFSTSITGNVDVDAQGNTTVHLPWWAFLYAKNTTDVKTSVSAAVQQSGVNFGAQADATANAQNSARLINAVTTAIQAQASANATASASTH
jgi:hypothetical protein